MLTIPTVSGVGLDGNCPEIAEGIEAAVADGMDVINLSLGEPEIEPSRDIVVQGDRRRRSGGRRPAIAAGNDFDAFGARLGRLARVARRSRSRRAAAEEVEGDLELLLGPARRRSRCR